MRIISADELLANPNAPKVLIAAPPKFGKTSLLRTCSQALLDRTLFIAIEPGEMAVQGIIEEPWKECKQTDPLRVASMRPERWSDCRDVACLLAGPDPSIEDQRQSYSQAHYDLCIQKYGKLDLERFDLFFIDSISAASRMSIAWCKQQPEAFTKNGEPNTLGLYGLHGREMIAWFNQIQRARSKMVVFLCILDKMKDEYGRSEWDFQIDGGMAARSLAGIVDVIAIMHDVDIEDIGVRRAFVTKGSNPHKFPAGDRHGGLDMYEAPDLQALIDKLTAKPAPAVAVDTGGKRTRKAA